jgi:hypothetical protein
VSGCGGKGDSPPTTPLTFSTTTPIPTSTVATPTSKPYIGPNRLPVETGSFLAPATTSRLGQIVDGIQCEPMAQLAYTSYAHLQVYVDGHSRAVPGGIGLVGPQPKLSSNGLSYSAATCMYWLHTRAADGLIEVQSPVSRRFTLGDLFAIWNQPLSSRRVARARGAVTATLDGVRWHGNPGTIPLTEHADIQLAVGEPVPAPQPVSWVSTNL